MRLPLPIDAYLDEIRARLRSHRALVLVAEPGAGKTTRVPPALVDDGPVIVLQPRRAAARSIARRIAVERGWTVGDEVGWHVRGERRFGERTRLLLATEGILTARLQADPLASAFRTIVVDEFHERTVHADLGLALARQAWLARGDLRLVVMSATLDAEPVRAFLGGCPLVDVPGRSFAVEVRYRPGAALPEAAQEALEGTGDDVLCFLPGAPEIGRAARDLTTLAQRRELDLVPLHGGLDADAQDRALRRGTRRRVVLATNVAETSLTIEGVSAVVDTGLRKAARYDAARGLDSLEVGRISADSGAQRAGRAGRTGPGLAIRLWDARDRLRAHREPEIQAVDLAPVLLDVIAWGGEPARFEWFEAPTPDRVGQGLALLARLGAVDGVRLTPLGERMRRLPLHPRLARLLLDAQGSPAAVLACALLSERAFLPPRHEATDCDLLSAVQDERSLPPHVIRTARDLGQAAARVLGGSPRAVIDAVAFRRAVLAAYPDAWRSAARQGRHVSGSCRGAAPSWRRRAAWWKASSSSPWTWRAAAASRTPIPGCGWPHGSRPNGWPPRTPRCRTRSTRRLGACVPGFGSITTPWCWASATWRPTGPRRRGYSPRRGAAGHRWRATPPCWRAPGSPAFRSTSTRCSPRRARRRTGSTRYRSPRTCRSRCAATSTTWRQNGSTCRAAEPSPCGTATMAP